MARWRFSAVLALAAALGAAALSGCSRKAESVSPVFKEADLVVPDFPTAREQFGYATAYQQAQVLSAEKKKRDVQLDKIMQVHRKVIVNYPNDMEFTPLSRMMLADCVSDQGNVPKARELWAETAKLYPDNQYLQARSLYSIGRSYERQGDFARSKQYYQDVMQRYGSSDSAAVRKIAERCKSLYFEVKEEQRDKKAKKPAK